jgi:dipeptidyl aminopeptidase/acylaminoacyl peptidase
MQRHVPAIRTAVLAALTLLLTPATTLLGQQSRPASQSSNQTATAAPDPRLTTLATEDYLTPPDPVLTAVMATTTPDLRLSNADPTGRYFLRTTDDGFPTLARFAKRHYDLGQFQVDPAANRERRLTTRSDVGIEVYGRDGKLVTTVDVPDGARVSGTAWSPDGSRIAYFAHLDDATHIYVADRATGESTRLTGQPVLATHVTSLDWTRDGEHIVTVLVPADRGPEPPAPDVPESPKVRTTTPERNALRTYFDLLENPHEKRLVQYYSTGQLARIDAASGDAELIGQPAMIEGVDASPDGGELIIYAPHLKEISLTHGKLIEEVGYHVRDYFVKQWDKFAHYPWGVLAHSTHVRGQGTYENGIEKPRVKVTLASQIPPAVCERINLGYRDPATIDVESFANREHEGVLLVRKAGEQLYRLEETIF